MKSLFKYTRRALAAIALSSCAVLSAQAGTLRMWELIDPTQDNPRGRHLKDEIARFEKENPGMKVQVEVLPWAQLSPQLIQAAAAGRTPDVIRVLGWNMPEQIAAKTVAPLNEFIDKLPAAERADWVVPWESTVWKGQKMAIPLEIRTAVMYYRKDLLAKVNRPVPRTVDEMIDTAKLLAQLPNTQGLAVGLARAGDAVAMIEPFYSMMWAAGGEVVDQNGKAVFNSPAGVKVVTKIKEMIDKGALPRSALGYTYEEVYSGVRSGTAAMAFLGSQRVVAARDAGKLGANLATAPLPGFAAGTPAPAHAFGWQLVIGKDSKHKGEAWKLIQHLTSTDAQVRRAQATGELPTRKSAYKHAFFQTPEAQEVREWVAYVGSNPKTAHYPRRFTEMSQLIVDAIQQVVLSNADPKQALDKAADRFNAMH